MFWLFARREMGRNVVIATTTKYIHHIAYLPTYTQDILKIYIFIYN